MMLARDYYITIGTDIMALLILLGLWLVPKSQGEKEGSQSNHLKKKFQENSAGSSDGENRKDYTGTRIFGVMSLFIIVGAVFDIISAVMEYYVRGRELMLVMVSYNAVEICTLWFLFCLMLYSDFRLFESRAHLWRHYRPYLIPVGISTLIYIINIFTGILFTVTEDYDWTLTAFFYLMEIVQFVFLILPAVYFIFYYFRNDTKRFLHPLSIYIPIICGVLISDVSDFSVQFLGYAIGLTFSVFAGVDHWRFVDMKTLFYNSAYLEFILANMEEGKETRGSMILFEAAGSREGFVRLLREELPADSEVISLGKGRFLFLSERRGRSELSLLADLVKGRAQEYDRTHPGKEIRPEILLRVFKDETGMITDLKGYVRD